MFTNQLFCWSNQLCREARYVNRTVALRPWPEPTFRPNAIEMATIFALLKFCMVRFSARAKAENVIPFMCGGYGDVIINAN
jgi:hypothetical protein